MKMSGNTILVSGAGTVIGAELAKAFHTLGNQVVLAGRDMDAMRSLSGSHPGMEVVELDIRSEESIQNTSSKVMRDYPLLNVVINHAGIIRADDTANRIDNNVAINLVETNLLGPVRLTSALMPALHAAPSATIIYLTSVSAFMPLATFSIYSAAKAALHSYAMSQRFLLADTAICVREIVLPCIGEPAQRNPPLPIVTSMESFIDQVVQQLAGEEKEIFPGNASFVKSKESAQHYRTFEQLNKLFISQSY